MLVLSRKKHEQIYIGNDIVLTVVRIYGNAVKLGITAPSGVQIDRDEVRRRRIEGTGEANGHHTGEQL